MMFWGIWIDGQQDETPLALFLQEQWAREWAKSHLDTALFRAGYEVLPVTATWTAYNPDEEASEPWQGVRRG